MCLVINTRTFILCRDWVGSTSDLLADEVLYKCSEYMNISGRLLKLTSVDKLLQVQLNKCNFKASKPNRRINGQSLLFLRPFEVLNECIWGKKSKTSHGARARKLTNRLNQKLTTATKEHKIRQPAAQSPANFLQSTSAVSQSVTTCINSLKSTSVEKIASGIGRVQDAECHSSVLYEASSRQHRNFYSPRNSAASPMRVKLRGCYGRWNLKISNVCLRDIIVIC